MRLKLDDIDGRVDFVSAMLFMRLRASGLFDVPRQVYDRSVSVGVKALLLSI